MINRTIKMGIIGCGRVAQHYRNVIEMGGIKGLAITACCDTNVRKANEMASAFSSKSYTDYFEMLAQNEFDVVAILTESGKHYEHAKYALEKDLNVIVEKPVALIPEQAYELDKIANERSLFLEAVFQNRYNPAIIKLKEAVDRGRFKKIITAGIRLRWCRFQDYYEDGWHGTWYMDGGVINQQCIHHVDVLNWLCGPVKRVVASSTNRLNLLEAEDTMVAAVDFNSGAKGTIEATTAARPEDFEASLSIVGEGGMVTIGGIALNQIDNWSFVNPEPGDENIPSKYSQDVPTGYGLGHIPLLKEVVKRIQNGYSCPSLTASQGADAVVLVHALYSSIEQNGWVNLSDKTRSERLGKIEHDFS